MYDITTAVIGAGQWGSNLIRIFHQKSKLKYIVDTDLSKLIPYNNITTTTDNLKKVLDDNKIQAVIVVTPPETHFGIVDAALLAGKHVLCEKPLVTSYLHAEILRNSKKEKQVLMTDHTFLFAPEVRFIKQFIDDGKLGWLFCIHTSRGNFGRFQKCNVLMDLAPHDISIFNYLINARPVRLIAYGRDYIQHDIEDVAYLSIDYITKVMATARFSWIDPRRVRETIIIGEDKMIVYTMGSEEPIKIYDKGVDKKYYEDVKDYGSYLLSYRHGDVVSPKLDNWEPLQCMADEFLKRCQENYDPPDSISGIDFSMGVVKLLEEANHSLLGNRRSQSLGWRKLHNVLC